MIEALASHGMIFVALVRQSLGNLGITAPDTMSIDLNMDHFSYMAHLRIGRLDYGRARNLRILTSSREKLPFRMSVFSIGYGCYRQNLALTSESREVKLQWRISQTPGLPELIGVWPLVWFPS